MIRTAKSLGFEGMDDPWCRIAAELEGGPSQVGASRRRPTKSAAKSRGPIPLSLDLHVATIAGLRREVSAHLFERAVEHWADAPRVVVFGIRPSSHVAGYLALRPDRFGLRVATLADTGLLAADTLRHLAHGDRLVVLAYGHPYRELPAVLDEADRLDPSRMLLTDTFPAATRRRFDIVPRVARGRFDMPSMHAATMTLVEALLVGVAAALPAGTMESLRALNLLRERLTGTPMDSSADASGSGSR